ncbi:MAG TPA: DUF1194 domain-containing protein [Alphaproteobacteria bacterium]|nr:DUF1194 domain-containing protein [Alphaproteobacteria bacterium]
MLSRIVLVFLLVLAAPVTRAQEAAVDLELVLAVDVSGSIDDFEARQQREGYLAAIVHPDVLDAIAGGYLRRIALTYVEWSGPGQQRTVVEWRLIDGQESAESFAAALAEAPLSPMLYTSISEAVAYAGGLFDGNGFDGARRVIDISGDGPNNSGQTVAAARAAALAAGITINGLPIMNDRAQPFGLPTPNQLRLDRYYEESVIGGPGAFIVVAENFEAFRAAILQKLILEIAGAVPADKTLHVAADR